jgi:hypothetical protein
MANYWSLVCLNITDVAHAMAITEKKERERERREARKKIKTGNFSP